MRWSLCALVVVRVLPLSSSVSEPDFSAEEPTLSEFDGVRYLHFGTEWVQGAMYTGRPSDLVLAYTRQMMSWLLFLQPSARDTVGIMGLGAASLLRFTLRHTRCQVETVEWNPAVTRICEQYFRLPRAARSVIDHCDAADWVVKPHNIGRFMALMVDLYDASAQGPVRSGLGFYTNCRNALADTGMLVVNLFGNHDSFAPNLQALRQAFNGRLLELPEIDEGNRVVLAFKGPVLDITTAQLLDRAQYVASRYGLSEAPRWARSLLAQKASTGLAV
jgi:spermidine synthase